MALSCFYPHYVVSSVVEITPERLATLGIQYLLLDVDCTLKRYSQQAPEPEIERWLDSLRAANVKMCLLSNGVGARIQSFARLVDLPYIAPACKPFTKGCRRAFNELGFVPTATAIIGDQIFADIMAARLSGVRAFLTTPLSPEEEHWFTRVKRPFEKIVMRSYFRRFPDGVWKDQSTRD
ncbi:MAG: YqeG family HAD IIIA-type phosphatase [Planctomycetia bacterium]|nr:YqeG family HAD IIIA-type phosphatase [Planctomycetia bacterium]